MSWHALTLEDLVCVSASQSFLYGDYHVSFHDVTGSYICAGCEQTESCPPKAGPQDDLNTYIILKWCPWFSHTFGVLSEEHVNMLTFRLLARNSVRMQLPLELVTAILLVLTEPNVPHAPRCKDVRHTEHFLFSR